MLLPSHHLLWILFAFSISIVKGSSRELNRCRSCVQFSKEVDSRVEKTGKKGGQVAVGKRFGPNGETIHKKLIDYADSENRFLDIFDESLCDGNDHKSECYMLFDDNEAFFSSWFFQQGRDNFLQKFCFSHVSGCSQERLDEADRKEAEEKAKRELEEKAKKELEAAQEAEAAKMKGQKEGTPNEEEVKPATEETVKSETASTLLDRLQDIPFYTRLLVVGIMVLMFYTITTYISVASDTRAYRKVQ